MVRRWRGAAAIAAMVSVVMVAPASFSAVISAVIGRGTSATVSVVAGSIAPEVLVLVLPVVALVVVACIIAVVVAVAVIVAAVVPLVVAAPVSSVTILSPSVEPAVVFPTPACLIFVGKPPRFLGPLMVAYNNVASFSLVIDWSAQVAVWLSSLCVSD